MGLSFNSGASTRLALASVRMERSLLVLLGVGVRLSHFTRRVGSALEYIFSLLPRRTVKHHVDDFHFLVAVARDKPPALLEAKSVSVAVAGSSSGSTLVFSLTHLWSPLNRSRL